MYIREAVKEDNDSLKSLQAQCTTGKDIMVTTVNEPDFFARSNAYEDCKVYVAFDDDNNDAIGSIACAMREVFINGKMNKVGYIFQMFTSPKLRRKGIGSKLYTCAEEHLLNKGVKLFYFVVMRDNLACMNLYHKMGYDLHSTYVMPCISVYKKMKVKSDDYIIRTMKAEDVKAVIGLLKNNWSNYDLYEQMTPEKFIEEVERIPEYTLDNIIVLEQDGKVKACLGFWDWSKITHLIVKNVNSKLQFFSKLLNVVQKICCAPNIPKVDQVLKQLCLTHIAYSKAEEFTILLKYLNNLAFDMGIEQICFTCENENILLKSIKDFFHINVTYNIYIKYCVDGMAMSNSHVMIRGIDL